MTIEAGSQLGHYQIVSKIGAGGMGEVYRAKDARLNRNVAIKVLPTDFASDASRLQRFEQEALATSALNHPNILTVYDIGNYEGAPYLVAELLEGEELREELNDGPLSAKKAVNYAQQVAAGLAAAHEKGIVHRDLKPENLFITKDGRVKILDFGLAKLRQERAPTSSSEIATQRKITEAGTVMGTVSYMSPEQVRGGDVDHRSDIFSFGVILYEVLSGQRPFTGDTSVEVMNAILKEEPQELSEVNPKISPSLGNIVRHCLEKRAERRFQTASDLGFALEALSMSSSSGSNQTQVAQTLTTRHETIQRSRREPLAWIGLAVMTLVAVAAGAAWLTRERPPAEVVRFQINPPEKTTFELATYAISPNGRFIAMSATDVGGRSMLYLRPLDSFTAQPLPGTEDGRKPFWSPDSKTIGYFSGGKLKRVELSGGPSQVICDAETAGGGSWNSSGVIIFTAAVGGRVLSVAASGGIPVPVTNLEESRGDTWHWGPRFLPDGQHFILHVGSRQPDHIGIYLGSLTDKSTKLLLRSEFTASYSAGYMLSVRNGALTKQKFDPDSFKLTGEPSIIAEQLRTGYSDAYFSASDNGTIIYQGGSATLARMIWFDRNGKEIGRSGEPGDYTNPSLSPDNKRVAVGLRDPQSKMRDIWLFDTARGVNSRFTFDPADDLNPAWSGDGSRIFFTSTRKGKRDIFQKRVNTADQEELIYSGPDSKNVDDVTSDGRFLIYNTNSPGATKNDLWLLPLSGEGKAQPYLMTQFGEDQAVISPNGRYVAYRSDESGRNEVYVSTFPTPGGKWQVSSGGGDEPQWRRDGKELYFSSENKKIWAVSVNIASTVFESDSPKLLFEAPLFGSGRNRFVVTNDGQRFMLITRLEDATTPINVVVNWGAETRK